MKSVYFRGIVTVDLYKVPETDTPIRVVANSQTGDLGSLSVVFDGRPSAPDDRWQDENITQSDKLNRSYVRRIPQHDARVLDLAHDHSSPCTAQRKI